MCKEHIKIKWRPTIFAEAKFKDRSKLLAKLNLRPYQARPILKPGKVLMYTLKMMIYFSIWEGEWKDLVFSLKPPPPGIGIIHSLAVLYVVFVESWIISMKLKTVGALSCTASTRHNLTCVKFWVFWVYSADPVDTESKP